MSKRDQLRHDADYIPVEDLTMRCDQILIRPYANEAEKDTRLIEVPDAIKPHDLRGIVVKVGPGLYNEHTGEIVDHGIRENDLVILIPQAYHVNSVVPVLMGNKRYDMLSVPACNIVCIAGQYKENDQ